MTVALLRLPIALGLLLSLPAVSQAEYQFAGRLTTPSTDLELDAGGETPAVSADGSVIAFASTSSNLGVPSNGSTNIYLYLISTDTYYLAQTGLGTGNSISPSVAEGGGAVAFQSEANDLVTGNQSGQSDVFYSILASDSPVTFATFLVSQGLGGAAANGASRYPSISRDGRWVTFHSDASNLIANDTNGDPDIFVADANDFTSPPELISVDDFGNPIDGPSRQPSPDSISADGRYVVFAVDTPVSIDGSNAGTLEDVFLRDRLLGTTRLISKATDGTPGSSSSSSPAISPNGRFVAFFSFSTNLTPSPSGSRIYVRDRLRGTTTNLPLPPGAFSCEDPRVSNRGRVTAQCNTSGPQQAFLYDPFEAGGTFYRLSTSLTQQNGNGASGNFTGISANGAIVAFDSAASDLVANDLNSSSDVFAWVPEPGAASAGGAAIAALAAAARRGRRTRT
jgi:Tol biopolymer transport system component